MMQEYEYVAIQRLHEKLKDVIDASIFVNIRRNESLFVEIKKKDLRFERYFDNITDDLISGSFSDKYCDLIVKEYKRFILSKYFY